MSKDLRGFTPPKKMTLRATPEGFKTKVWYRNGSGPMWMWTFYFTDPQPTIEAAVREARRVVAQNNEKNRINDELDKAVWKHMARSLKDMVPR